MSISTWPQTRYESSSAIRPQPPPPIPIPHLHPFTFFSIHSSKIPHLSVPFFLSVRPFPSITSNNVFHHPYNSNHPIQISSNPKSQTVRNYSRSPNPPTPFPLPHGNNYSAPVHTQHVPQTHQPSFPISHLPSTPHPGPRPKPISFPSPPPANRRVLIFSIPPFICEASTPSPFFKSPFPSNHSRSPPTFHVYRLTIRSLLGIHFPNFSSSQPTFAGPTSLFLPSSPHL